LLPLPDEAKATPRPPLYFVCPSRYAG
jgi:hypothetical protein